MKLPPYVTLFLVTSAFNLQQLEAKIIFLSVVQPAICGVIWECGIGESQIISSEHSGYQTPSGIW